MEKIDKEVLASFRKEIAELEKEQKIIKPQRKTVYFTGERTMGPSEATYKAISNSGKLRAMYAAYNLLRGKGFYVTENNAKPLNGEDFYNMTGYTLMKELEGKHPLCLYMDEIQSHLRDYGFEMPSHYEKKETFWGTRTEKVFDYENYEKIVRVSE